MLERFRLSRHFKIFLFISQGKNLRQVIGKVIIFSGLLKHVAHWVNRNLSKCFSLGLGKISKRGQIEKMKVFIFDTTELGSELIFLSEESNILFTLTSQGDLLWIFGLLTYKLQT